MEQRNGDRKAVALDAVVVCPCFGLLRGEIVDLAAGGMYIQAETSIVPIGAEVSVNFQPGAEICAHCLSARCEVVHQNPHGFGVRFVGLDAECRSALAALLPASPPGAVRSTRLQRAL